MVVVRFAHYVGVSYGNSFVAHYALFWGLDIKIAKKMKAVFIKCWECRGLGPAKEFLYMNIKWEGSKIMID